MTNASTAAALACLTSVSLTLGSPLANAGPAQDDIELAKACATMTARGIKVAECNVSRSSRTPVAGLAAARPGPSSRAVATPQPPAAVPDNDYVLLRQDQYDQVSFAQRLRGYEVIQGAAFSYSNDQKTRSQSFSTKSFLGYSAYNWASPAKESRCNLNDGPLFVAGFGGGPFVLADGNYNEPTNANERSALRAGVNLSTIVCGSPVFERQEFQFMPYAQTDFRGRASIAGFDALWEPYLLALHLGGRADVDAPKLIGYYFRAVGEANVFNVNNAGLTNFMPNSNYALIGGTLEARAVLFENNRSVPPALCGTISLVGSARYLWDAVSQKAITNYGAEVNYRLAGTTPSTAFCEKDKTAQPGSSSVGLSYTTGTNPTTFVTQNVYKAQLKFSY